VSAELSDVVHRDACASMLAVPPVAIEEHEMCRGPPVAHLIHPEQVKNRRSRPALGMCIQLANLHASGGEIIAPPCLARVLDCSLPSSRSRIPATCWTRRLRSYRLVRGHGLSIRLWGLCPRGLAFRHDRRLLRGRRDRVRGCLSARRAVPPLLDFRHPYSYVMQQSSHDFGELSVIQDTFSRNVCQ
jgi:hypothetical protein